MYRIRSIGIGVSNEDEGEDEITALQEEGVNIELILKQGFQSELSTGSASWESIYGSSDGDDSSSSSMGDMGDDQSSALGDVTSSGSSSGSSASDSTSFYNSMVVDNQP